MRTRRDGTPAIRPRAVVTAALAALSLSLGVLSLSCTGPTVAAFGEIDDVVVLVGEGASGRPAELLEAALRADSAWLVGEQRFKARVADVRELNDFTYRRHLLLLGTWDDPHMSKVVRSRVGGMAPGDPPTARAVEDIWGEGQVVMAVMAGSRSELTEYLSNSSHEVVDRLVSAARDRLARKLREELEDTGFDLEMDGRFGWSLGPPTGYDLHPGHEEEGMAFFRKTRPDRTIFVHWTAGSPDDVTEEYAIEKRNEMGSLYFDGDQVEWRRELVVDNVEFRGRRALCVSGWWGNRELVGGGPFRSYCFHVPEQRRTYLIDAAVFAPALEKTPIVRNLDAALHTFRAAGD